MTVTAEDALQMVAAFTQAATGCPLRQVRSEMDARRAEWQRAIDTIAEQGDDYVIELAGAVVGHMRMPVEGAYGAGVATIVRAIHRDGGCTIHYEDPQTGQARYLNMHSAASPVVVRR